MHKIKEHDIDIIERNYFWDGQNRSENYTTKKYSSQQTMTYRMDRNIQIWIGTGTEEIEQSTQQDETELVAAIDDLGIVRLLT